MDISKTNMFHFLMFQLRMNASQGSKEDDDIYEQLDNIHLSENDVSETEETEPTKRRARGSETDNGDSAMFSAIQRLINENNCITADEIANELDTSSNEVKNFMRTVMALVYKNGQWANCMGREPQEKRRSRDASNEEGAVGVTSLNNSLVSARNVEDDLEDSFPENISRRNLRSEEDWEARFRLPTEDDEDDVFNTPKNNLDTSLRKEMTDFGNSNRQEEVDEGGFDVSETLSNYLKNVKDWNESFRLPTAGEKTEDVNSEKPEAKLNDYEEFDLLPELNVAELMDKDKDKDDCEFSFRIPTEKEVEMINEFVKINDTEATRDLLADMLNMTPAMVAMIIDNLKVEAQYIEDRDIPR